MVVKQSMPCPNSASKKSGNSLLPLDYSRLSISVRGEMSSVEEHHWVRVR